MGLIQYVKEHPLTSALAGAASFLGLDIAYRMADGISSGNIEVPYFEAIAAGTLAVIAGGKILYDHVNNKESAVKSRALEDIAEGKPKYSFQLPKNFDENQLRRQVNVYMHKMKPDALDKKALAEFLEMELESMPGESAEVLFVANDLSKYGKIYRKDGTNKEFNRKTNLGLIIKHYGADGRVIGMRHYTNAEIFEDKTTKEFMGRDFSHADNFEYKTDDLMGREADEELDIAEQEYARRASARAATPAAAPSRTTPPGRRGRNFRN